MIPKYTSIDVCERRAAGQRHRNLQLGAQNGQQVHDADGARERDDPLSPYIAIVGVGQPIRVVLEAAFEQVRRLSWLPSR